jgi:hypothetical protein
MINYAASVAARGFRSKWATGPRKDKAGKNYSKRKSSRSQPHIGVMHIDLSDTETEALTQELPRIIESSRYPLSPRTQTLRAILAKLRPEPVREPLPQRKVYAPPRAVLGRRRRRG